MCFIFQIWVGSLFRRWFQCCRNNPLHREILNFLSLFITFLSYFDGYSTEFSKKLDCIADTLTSNMMTLTLEEVQKMQQEKWTAQATFFSLLLLSSKLNPEICRIFKIFFTKNRCKFCFLPEWILPKWAFWKAKKKAESSSFKSVKILKKISARHLCSSLARKKIRAGEIETISKNIKDMILQKIDEYLFCSREKY